jgi:hypothetical protein
MFSYLFIYVLFTVYLTTLCVAQAGPTKRLMLVRLVNNILDWIENECIVAYVLYPLFC